MSPARAIVLLPALLLSFHCGTSSTSEDGAGLATPEQDGAPRPDAGSEAEASKTGILLFGGEDGHSKMLADTWVFDGTTWTELDAHGPSPRARGVMGTLGSTVMLFGGWAVGGEAGPEQVFGDTWTWDRASWTEVHVPGPSPRDDGVLAELGGKLVMFGGLSATNHVLDETWTWDGKAWAKLAATGPSARKFPTMAECRGRLILSGGLDAANHVLDDTWAFDGSAWTKLDVPGPTARWSAVAATVRDEVVLFSGYQNYGTAYPYPIFDDTWAFDGSAWRKLDGAPPTARASAAIAPLGGSLYVFGGYGPRYSLADTWRFDDHWTLVADGEPAATNPNGPTGRTRPVMTTLPTPPAK